MEQWILPGLDQVLSAVFFQYNFTVISLFSYFLDELACSVWVSLYPWDHVGITLEIGGPSPRWLYVYLM